MSNVTKQLKVKDLVSIGVFFVIYLVSLYVVGMIGLLPILFLVWPTVQAIVSGTIVMLFMAKVPKPWALFIFGILTPLFMFAMGHTWVVAVHGIGISVIAEIIFRAGKFKSFKHTALAYAVFSCGTCGGLIQMLWAKEKYLKMLEDMPAGYAEKVEALISYPSMALVYAGAFAGGIIGAFIGKAMLKKHFEKSGIV